MEEETSSVFSKYSSEIDRLPIELQNSAAILYSCIVTVINESIPESENQDFLKKNHQTASSWDIYSNEGKFESIELHGVDGSMQALFTSTVPTMCKKDIMVAEFDDRLTFDRFKLNNEEVNNAPLENPDHHTSTEGLLFFEHQALIRGQIRRLRQDRTMPEAPELSEIERSIRETELLSFSSLARSDLFRSHQMQELVSLLHEHTKDLPNFTGALREGSVSLEAPTKRRFFRYLPSLLLAQILAAEQAREPLVLRKYYAPTDNLLIALHWPPPDRRMRRDHWQMSDGVKAVLGAPPQPTFGTDVCAQLETVTLTPAGRSIVQIKRFNVPGLPWLTIHINGAVLGLRLDAKQIQATFDSRKNDVLAKVAPPRRSSAAGLGEDGKDQVASEQTDDDAAVQPTKVSLATQQEQALAHAWEELVGQTDGGLFFCHTEDDVRFVACRGPSGMAATKPDGLGTVCLLALLPNGLAVNICSNGNVKMTPSSSPQKPTSMDSYGAVVLTESSRVLGARGVVARTLSDPLFSRELLFPDGGRLLHRRETISPKGGPGESDALPQTAESVQCDVLRELLDQAPLAWTALWLDGQGKIFFRYTVTQPAAPGDLMERKPLGEGEVGPEKKEVSTEVRCSRFLRRCVDAETKSSVCCFRDGRLLIHKAGGALETRFPDGTTMVTHAKGEMLIVTHPSMPQVELDLETDRVARSHAGGVEVPINRGGNRVRSRIALPDGSAAVIKYDTKVTATANGSLRVVRRGRASLSVADDGSVTYQPWSAWNQENATLFVKDSSEVELAQTDVAERVSRLTGEQRDTDETDSEGEDEVDAGATPASNAHRTPAKAKKQVSHSPDANSPYRKRRSGVLPGLTPSPAKLAMGHMQPPSPPSAFKSKAQSRRGQTQEQKSHRDISNPKVTIGGHSDELVSSKIETQTKFQFNIDKLTCRIQDHEYNTFEVGLKDKEPMQPKVTLSGEVEGLKPPAVADAPMPPRLFVVDRSAEALELVSHQEFSELEGMARLNVDAKKISVPVQVQPSELGPCNMHQFILQRRLVGGENCDFQQIFGPRDWHEDKVPAAARYMINTLPCLEPLRREKKSAGSRVFNNLSLIERQPLSDEGYRQLTQTFEKCEKFRTDRQQSISRFAVEDTRTQEQLDEELAVGKRLRVAYKAAKVTVAKRREQREKDATAADTASAASRGSTPSNNAGAPMNLGHRQASVIPEGNEEEEEEGDGDVDFEDDEEDEVPAEVDTEELEIRAAFHDFAVPLGADSAIYPSNFSNFASPVHNTPGGAPPTAMAELNHVLPLEDLQDALIRLMNCYVPPDTLQQNLKKVQRQHQHYSESNQPAKGLSMYEFRSLYRALMPATDGVSDDGSRSYLDANSDLGSRGSDTVDSGDMLMLDGESRLTPSASTPQFWQSKMGQNTIPALPKTAPPLDFRQLNWNHGLEEGSAFGSEPLSAGADSKGDGSYAAGSALQAARRNINTAKT